MEFKNLQDVFVKFQDEEVCRTYLEKLFWNGKPECPFCQYTEKIYRIEKGKRYKCKQCQKKFSITVGTIFENTNIPMSKWFGAIYLITSHKKGISSLQLHRDLGVTQKTAWFMLHRLREMIKDQSPVKLTNTIEIDESYIGGKEINKHKKKRKEGTTGRSNAKTPVIGIIERGGKIHTEKMTSASQEQMFPIIQDKVKAGSTIITDEFPIYQRLSLNFDHFTINHKAGNYANGEIHTNTIEGYWSLFKRGIVGIYHSITYKHLNAYCNEFTFRYNTRHLAENTRFELAISQAVGRRLMYKLLTYRFRYG